ncbi:MAG: thioredoxin [Bacilli bacterium]|nr:thioredoxin [Bacilli bacterium]
MIKHVNTSEFNEEIKKNSKVLVDFYADWCGPCKMLGPVLENLEKDTDITILKVDVDKEPIAYEYNVTSIPTVILFKDGKVDKQAIGFMRLDELKEFVK